MIYNQALGGTSMLRSRWLNPKIYLLVLGAISFMVAVACGSSATATTAPQPTATQEQATAVPGTTAPDATPTPRGGSMTDIQGTVVPTATPETTSLVKPWESIVENGKYGGVLPMGMLYELDHWDTQQACCNRSLYNARDLYSTLVAYDYKDQTTIVGDLAQSWEWADDGMSITFQLWDHAQWSDGEPVTADDIVFSLDRMVEDKIRPRVRNIGPYYANSEAVDPYTVVVNTKLPNPGALIPFLGIDYMIMMPKHVLEGRDDAEQFFDNPSNIVASGSMLFISHELGNFVEMERNPNYFKEGLPFLDGIKSFVIADKSRQMAALTTEQILLSPGFAPTEREAADFQELWGDNGTLYFPGENAFRFFEMNVDNPPLDDPRVRRALYLAVDRKQLLDVTRLGRGTQGIPFFPNTWMSSSAEEIATWPGFRYVDAQGDLFLGKPALEDVVKDPQDLQLARDLLTEAGFPDGLTLQYHVGVFAKEEALLVQQQLKLVGIEVDLKVTDTTTGFNAEQEKTYEHILHLGHGTNILDPDDMFLGVYLPGGPRNAIGFEDPKIRALFDTQQVESDFEKRKALIKEAEEVLRQGESHIVLLFWLGGASWAVNEKVKNFITTPIGLQYGFSKENLWIDN
jgi:peptide/nickel transport system substrate-binding protein